jgi:MFS family permease
MTLFLLCLACGLWAIGFGLECPLASRWLEDAGRSEDFIGLNTGTHFLGVIAAGLATPALMRRAGRGCIAVGLVLSAVAVAMFPWGGTGAGSFALRFLAGAGGALAMVPLESLVNFNAPEHRRARDFGFYAASVGLGFALGSGLGLAAFQHAPDLSFLLGGVTLLGVLAVPYLPRVPEEEAPTGPATPFRPPFLSLGSSWTQGFLEAGMLALLPLYLASLGAADGETGLLLGVILAGVIVFQLPVAWLADRIGRERVLVGCFAVVAVGLAAIPHLGRGFTLWAWLIVVGVCSGAFYPLGLALMGERLPAADIPRANAWYLGVNCCGCLVSPVIGGPVMAAFGRAGMFYTALVVVLAVLMVWGFMPRRGRTGRRRAAGGWRAARAAPR